MGAVRGVRRGRARYISLVATGAPVGAEALFPAEQHLAEGASAVRVAELATGRDCAHQALAALDPRFAGMPVLRDPSGAPRWPAGTVGSITHCRGWTGAVAARSRASLLGRGVRAIGLDAEPTGTLPDGVLEVVASVHEREALARLGGAQPGIPWDTVLFCAKEATYKAWSPLAGILLSHDQVEVEVSAEGRFTGRAAAVDDTGREVVHSVRGRWRVGPRVVVALGIVP